MSLENPSVFCHFILFTYQFIFGAQFAQILLNSLHFIGWFLILSIENFKLYVISGAPRHSPTAVEVCLQKAILQSEILYGVSHPVG